MRSNILITNAIFRAPYEINLKRKEEEKNRQRQPHTDIHTEYIPLTVFPRPWLHLALVSRYTVHCTVYTVRLVPVRDAVHLCGINEIIFFHCRIAIDRITVRVHDDEMKFIY